MSADNDDPEMELEELLMTPNGNEARERCPICNRPNAPGACDACNHYYAAYWDGELMWEVDESLENFHKEWENLQIVLDEVEESSSKAVGDTWLICKEFATSSGFDPVFLSLDPFETSSTEAFCEIVPFNSGPTIETDGMLSGAGYSIYMEEPGIVLQVASKIRELANLIDDEFNHSHP
jgi:hypothetical protein